MRLQCYCVFGLLAAGLFASGIGLMTHYGNLIPYSLTPQEQLELRLQSATPQQLSEALETKRLQSDGFRYTMVGVGLFGGGFLITVSIMIDAFCVSRFRDSVEPEPAEP